MHNAIQLLVKAGQFRQAADREKEVSTASQPAFVAELYARYLRRLTRSQIGSIYAQDGFDPAKARDSYVRAGDWYKQEDANA